MFKNKTLRMTGRFYNKTKQKSKIMELKEKDSGRKLEGRLCNISIWGGFLFELLPFELLFVCTICSFELLFIWTTKMTSCSSICTFAHLNELFFYLQTFINEKIKRYIYMNNCLKHIFKNSKESVNTKTYNWWPPNLQTF